MWRIGLGGDGVCGVVGVCCGFVLWGCLGCGCFFCWVGVGLWFVGVLGVLVFFCGWVVCLFLWWVGCLFVWFCGVLVVWCFVGWVWWWGCFGLVVVGVGWFGVVLGGLGGGVVCVFFELLCVFVGGCVVGWVVNWLVGL